MPGKTKTTNLKKITDLLEQHERLNAEADALMQEHGISQKLADAAEAKKQATELVVKAGVKSIDMPQGGRYDLRQDSYNKTIVGDTEDLANIKNPQAVIPLKTIIRKKFGNKRGANGNLAWQNIWHAITTRRVDVAKLEKIVSLGSLTVDEISPAYYEDKKSPYLRKY